MRSANRMPLGLIVLVTWVTQAHATELQANKNNEVKGYMDKLVDRFMGKLADRASKAWSLHHADLDDATLAKMSPSTNSLSRSSFHVPRLPVPTTGSQLPLVNSRFPVLHSLPVSEVREKQMSAKKPTTNEAARMFLFLKQAAQLELPESKAEHQQIAHEAREEASKVAARSKADLAAARRAQQDGNKDLAEDKLKSAAVASARADAASAAAISAQAAAGDIQAARAAAGDIRAEMWAAAATKAAPKAAVAKDKKAANYFATAASAGDWEAVAQAEDSAAPKFFAAVAKGDWTQAALAANDWSAALEEQNFWAGIGGPEKAEAAADWGAAKVWAAKAADLAAAVTALSASRRFEMSSKPPPQSSKKPSVKPPVPSQDLPSVPSQSFSGISSQRPPSQTMEGVLLGAAMLGATLNSKLRLKSNTMRAPSTEGVGEAMSRIESTDGRLRSHFTKRKGSKYVGRKEVRNGRAAKTIAR